MEETGVSAELVLEETLQSVGESLEEEDDIILVVPVEATDIIHSQLVVAVELTTLVWPPEVPLIYASQLVIRQRIQVCQ